MCIPKLALSTVMLATLGACASVETRPASSDPARPAAWKIQPVMTVQHSGTAAKSFYTLGRYYDGMRAWDRSIDAYQKSVAADPSYVEAHNALGAALAQRNRHGEATDAFRKALALNANLAHVQSNLGYVLLLSGQPQAAVAALKVAVRLDASNLTAMINLRSALAQWDIARGLEPAATATVAPVSNDKPTPNANEVVLNAQAASMTSVTLPAALPSTVEVMAPITSAQVAMPITSVALAAPVDSSPSSVRALASIEVSRPPVVTVSIERPTFMVAARDPLPMLATPVLMPAMRVNSEPTVPAMVQTSMRSIETMQPSAAMQAVPLEVTTPTGVVAAALPIDAPTPKPTEPAASPAAGTALPNVQPFKSVRPKLELVSSHRSSTQRVSKLLGRKGVQIDRTASSVQPRLKLSVIYYQVGHSEDAHRVARALPFKAQVRWAGAMKMDHDVRLVLGNDAQPTELCSGQASCKGSVLTLASHSPPTLVNR